MHFLLNCFACATIQWCTVDRPQIRLVVPCMYFHLLLRMFQEIWVFLVFCPRKGLLDVSFLFVHSDFCHWCTDTVIHVGCLRARIFVEISSWVYNTVFCKNNTKWDVPYLDLPKLDNLGFNLVIKLNINCQ